MNKKEIVEELAKKQTVENIVKKHTEFKSHPYINDLAQDIYIDLLDKDDKLIEKLYTDNEFEYYLKKLINNNLYSKTSPFYYKYAKFEKITNNIDDLDGTI